MTPVCYVFRVQVSPFHTLPHTATSCLVPRHEANKRVKRHRLPHTNHPSEPAQAWPGAAIRAEGSIQPAVSSMRSGRLREAVSIHPETHTRLAQAPPHYHRAHILVSGPLNPEGSPLLLTGWEGIGRGGSLSPKVEPHPLPSTPHSTCWGSQGRQDMRGQGFSLNSSCKRSVSPHTTLILLLDIQCSKLFH